MKFFTAAWHSGESGAESDQVLAEYKAHVAALWPNLPEDARRLCTDISLHDALVRGVRRTNSDLELVLRIGDRQRGYIEAVSVYGGSSIAAVNADFLDSVAGRRDTELLYDEFDSSDGGWVHRLLFWPYNEVSILFRTLKLDLIPVADRFDNSAQ